jgi:hypothetical protein
MKGDENISPFLLGIWKLEKEEIGVGFSDLYLSYINEDSILRYGLHVHSILFE